jgi:hypothetical protein
MGALGDYALYAFWKRWYRNGLWALALEGSASAHKYISGFRR